MRFSFKRCGRDELTDHTCGFGLCAKPLTIKKYYPPTSDKCSRTDVRNLTFCSNTNPEEFMLIDDTTSEKLNLDLVTKTVHKCS